MCLSFFLLSVCRLCPTDVLAMVAASRVRSEQIAVSPPTEMIVPVDSDVGVLPVTDFMNGSG